jgi:beta-ribofuranosylaminobenzene 5'-phosphate synthase
LLRVIGLSRIHITLFDLEGKHGRLDGGVGVALSRPRVVVRSGNCLKPDFQLPLNSPNYCVEEDYEPHIGLGHTTQYRLAIAKLAAEYNNVRADIRDLAQWTKRGTTSGVGIYAFAYGGLVVDGGHSIRVKSKPLPSDFSDAPPPPLLMRLDFPWLVYLNTPEGGRRIFGKEEIEAFKANVSGIDQLCRVVLMELIPSVAERDLPGVLDAILKIQELGFKKVEIGLQTEKVKSLMRELGRAGFPAGLSSFGPTLYTFVNTKREAEELVGKFGGTYVEPNNKGARVEWSI